MVINLDRSCARMERMTKQLRALELPFERVPAVDGLTQDVSRMTEISASAGVHPPRPVEVACFLSHRRCWQMIAAGDDPAAVILEDDIVFAKNARAVLQHSGLVPAGTDVVRLESWPAYVRVSRRAIDLTAGYELRRLHAGSSGAGAYAVSREGAAKLLRQSREYLAPVDLWLFSGERGLPSATIDTLVALPAPCIQFQFVYPGAPISTVGLESTLQHTSSRVSRSGAIVEKARVCLCLLASSLRHRGPCSVKIRLHRVGPMPE